MQMEHSRLLETLLHEIASARTGIAASYARLWRGEGISRDHGGVDRAEPAGGEPDDPTVDGRSFPEPDERSFPQPDE